MMDCWQLLRINKSWITVKRRSREIFLDYTLSNANFQMPWKSDSAFGGVFAHPLDVNSGAPIGYAGIILRVSDEETPCVGMAHGFWFEKSLCSEYQAKAIFEFSTFGWNMWKNEVSIKIHSDLPWRSSEMSY